MVRVPTDNVLATQTEPTATGPLMPAVTAKPRTTVPHVNFNAPCLVDSPVPDKEPAVKEYRELALVRVRLVGLDQIAQLHVLAVVITLVMGMVLATQQTVPAPALRVLP